MRQTHGEKGRTFLLLLQTADTVLIWSQMNCLIKSFMTWVLREVWKFRKIVMFSFDPILAGWKTRKTLFVDKILNI